MGTLFLNHFKKQASSFLHDNYNQARLMLTGITRAQLLTEEATNEDSWGPDARTMSRIAEASFDVDDYWRIVDVLHKRLYSIDWKQWRQAYKTLVLLDFLLTHGAEELAEEFLSDVDVIDELAAFKHKDSHGFDWGAAMQKKSERVIYLLRGGETLKEARLKAIKVSRGIQGFGSSSMPSSPSSASSRSSTPSSFGSFSSTGSAWNNATFTMDTKDDDKSQVWECPRIQEQGSLLDYCRGEKKDGFMSGICSRLASLSPSAQNVFRRSFSDDRRGERKKFDRQISTRY